MASESVTEFLSHPWMDADWRKPKSGFDDLGARGLLIGTFDEERSFGARPAPVSLGEVTLRETEGPHEVWAHAAGRDLAVTQLTPDPCRGHLLSLIHI